MIWAGMESGWLFGTYFFDVAINQHAYLDTLQNCFLSQLESFGIKDDPWFKQNGERACYALPVREYLSLASENVSMAVGHKFSSLHFTGHIEVPDLSPCENSLWGFLKEAVAPQRNQTPEDLIQAERLSFKRVTPKRSRKCSTENGAELFWHDDEVQTDTRDN